MNDRTYSTRELAQMWNVSESTIKRWADLGDLRCRRTPGGHRKFTLTDICDFQMKRGFEATGLLTTEHWEDPDLEGAVNEKKFEKIRADIQYLVTQNQRFKAENLLERLYMRGMGIVDLYDDILMPISESVSKALQEGQISMAQEKLISNNLEEAMYFLFPRIIRRRQNGKMGLAAAPAHHFCTLGVNAACRVLEVEGWDCLNLGTNVPLEAVAEMVEKEPVNLVCVMGSEPSAERAAIKQFRRLFEATRSYRIPLVLGGAAFVSAAFRERFPHDEYFPNFRSFRRLVLRLSR